MEPNKKRGIDCSEEKAKKKGKAVLVEEQPKGLYDDLVEESFEMAPSKEQGVSIFGLE